jgi:hypothetical protein
MALLVGSDSVPPPDGRFPIHTAAPTPSVRIAAAAIFQVFAGKRGDSGIDWSTSTVANLVSGMVDVAVVESSETLCSSALRTFSAV